MVTSKPLLVLGGKIPIQKKPLIKAAFLLGEIYKYRLIICETWFIFKVNNMHLTEVYMGRKNLVTFEEGLKLLKQKIKEDYGTQVAYADSQGFTPQYVNNVLQGKRAAPPHMLRMIGAKQIKAFEIDEE